MNGAGEDTPAFGVSAGKALVPILPNRRAPSLRRLPMPSLPALTESRALRLATVTTMYVA